MAHLCVNVVTCCSIGQSKEFSVEVKACPGRGNFSGSSRRSSRSRSCKRGRGDPKDAQSGFQRIDVEVPLMNGSRKDRSLVNGRSGSKGHTNSYELCTIVDCQARDLQMIDKKFEHSHVGIWQGEGLRIDLCEDRRSKDSEGDVPKNLGGRYEDDFHVGRRVLLAAVCTSMAFCSWSASGMEQVESKTAKYSAESGTNRSEAAIGEKREGSNLELVNREKITASRVYDATVLGEPVPVGGEKGRVWQKLLAARVVYLGEAERVPDPDDKVLELEILRTLRNKCFEQQRPVSLALDAFPVPLQDQLDKLSDEELKATVGFWPDGQWQAYLPLLHYCRVSGVRLMACGVPPEDADRWKYVPPIGGGFGAMSIPMVQELALADILPRSSVPYGQGPYQFAQARTVTDHTMAQVVTQGMADGGSVGLLIVVTGASHLLFGSRGVGLPARISKKLQKKTQIVVLLNPERQRIRMEGNVPEADFLWYSAEKPCTRNCFDRAEVARVMDAARSTHDELPQDMQAGLERGLVSPKVLQSFFELDKYPYISEISRHFQGLRERWLADPRFLQRLGIEETISITTTLIAQYERRGTRFWSEIEYVVTDTVRAVAVDFFTVWLPAPTLSFRSLDSQATGIGALDGLRGFLESLPDNAFQRSRPGENFGLFARVWAVVMGGMKLFGVGIVASIATLSISNGVWAIRKVLKPDIIQKPTTKRSPVMKTAFVYASFLGISSNLRYQAIAGIVEHWIADYLLASEPLVGSLLSFIARIGNSYWGAQQWVDIARATGIQAQEAESPSLPLSNAEDQEPQEDSVQIEINPQEPLI